MKVYEDADFIELLIKHLARSKKCNDLAKNIKMTPDDFMLDQITGIVIYKRFVEAIFRSKAAPISMTVLSLFIKEMLGKGELDEESIEPISQFLTFIYNDDPLQEDFICEHMLAFLKHRKVLKLQHQTQDDVVAFADEYAKIKVDFQQREVGTDLVSYSPFEEVVPTTYRDCIPTGIPSLDAVMDGIGYQEYMLLIGFSGGGKTATMINLAMGAASAGKKVMIISLEEPGAHISNRFYANEFEIDYTRIHKGHFGITDEIKAAVAGMALDRREKLKNIRVEDLRDMVDCTAGALQQFIEKRFQETGWHPDLVIIDQLDYMEADDKSENEGWEKLNRISFEVEALSNYLVGGEHPLAVVLLHQANGKPKKIFSRDDIAGFKGIIKPADLAIGVGRADDESPDMTLFTLKARHIKRFALHFVANFQFMKISESSVDQAVKKTEQPVLFGGYKQLKLVKSTQ